MTSAKYFTESNILHGSDAGVTESCKQTMPPG